MALSLSTTIQPNCLRLNRKTDGFPLKFKPNFSAQHRNTTPAGFASSPSRRFAISAVAGVDSSSVTEGTTNLLDTVQVFGLDGKGIRISDLWKDRKAVVAFARHFGCVLCRKRAAFLAAEKDKMDASGVALILIGPGSVEQARSFYEQTKFKGEVYADPSHASYDALKFAYGVLSTFTPKAGLKIIQSYMEGYRQDWALSSEKDTVTRGGWQQGGILVAGPGKDNISYIHRDKEAGDDPDIQEILTACCT
uniref:Thioredoxin-like protein AAED1, chloroplastic n=1 Tax=Kalanchoe fedtschenkoi TaxID=63787 RepID=A0A7N1A8V0_KALFE